MTPIEDYSATVAKLYAMNYKDALAYVTDPAHGFTPEAQRCLLSGRSRARCIACHDGPG